MNDTIRLDVRPEVARFVAEVRKHLADLSDEEREELVGGLEADLSELVSEHEGEPDVLGDPAAYAAELRAAAGFSPVMGKVPGRRSVRTAVGDGIDAVRAHWDALLDALPGSPRDFVETLQPAWWVLRAVVAWLLAQGLNYPWFTLDLKWSVVLVVFVIVSVQLGRGAWRTGDLVRRSVLARLGLGVLNAFAAVMAPVAFAHMEDGIADQSAWEHDGYYAPAGLSYDGSEVTNLFPYDADGRPLTGVQLFDRDGRPINAFTGESCCQEDGEVGYPWLNNGEARFNVFPLPQGEGDFDGMRLPDAWTSDNPPAIPAYPMETAPTVTLPTPSPAPAEPTAPRP